MNEADRKEFDIIHTKIDGMTQDIKFIKENLFNPHECLWAETKVNRQLRESRSKWRGVIGTGFIGLMAKQIWDMLNP